MHSKASQSALGRSLFILSFVALNALLWLPAMWRRSDLFTFVPFPDQHLARGFYDFCLFYLARRPSLDLAHISYDFIVLVLCGSIGMHYLKRPQLARFLTSLYLASLIYQIYQELLLGFRGRLPMFREDTRLLEPTLHFLSDSLGWKLWPILALIALAVFGAFKILERLWNRLLLGFESRSWLRSLGFTLLLVYAHICFYKYGPDRPDTIIRSSFYSAANNWSRSLNENPQARTPATDRSWEGMAELNPPLLSALPDIYLFVLESYGQVLTQDPELKPAYDEYMQSMESKLKRSGWSMRSQMSQAPVFGGGSWLSLATIHNGIWIPDQETYDALDPEIRQKARLLRLLESWGYETLGLMPGNRHEIGMQGRATPYGYQEMLEWKNIPYQGLPNNYAWIPDQYSLGWTFANRPLTADKPRMFFFMSTNSHAPWKGAPPILEDWRQLDHTTEPVHGQSMWGSFMENLHFAMELTQQKNVDRKAYLQSILYEWDAVAENIAHLPAERPALILILGDHQPYFADATQPNAPIHILSKDPRTLAVLDKVEFGKTDSNVMWKHDDVSRLILGLVLRDAELLAHNGRPSRQSMSHPAQHAH